MKIQWWASEPYVKVDELDRRIAKILTDWSVSGKHFEAYRELRKLMNSLHD